MKPRARKRKKEKKNKEKGQMYVRINFFFFFFGQMGGPTLSTPSLVIIFHAFHLMHSMKPAHGRRKEKTELPKKFFRSGRCTQVILFEFFFFLCTISYLALDAAEVR